jgi:hypothetical protein
MNSPLPGSSLLGDFTISLARAAVKAIARRKSVGALALRREIGREERAMGSLPTSVEWAGHGRGIEAGVYGAACSAYVP